jgi:hypothetical protein
MKVKLCDLPLISTDPLADGSPNRPVGVASSPDVALCAAASWLVHITVSPTLISTGLGEYALLVLVDASSVMSTATSAANAGVGVDTGASITARTAASPTATAIFEFIDY